MSDPDRAVVGSHLMERIISNMFSNIPSHADAVKTMSSEAVPALSVSLLTQNFRQFSARIGIVFAAQEYVRAVLAWQRPQETLSYLLLLTLVMQNPLVWTPSILALAFVFLILVPAYCERHPAVTMLCPSTKDTDDDLQIQKVRPLVFEGRDFLLNMRDIQNLMASYSISYDRIRKRLVPLHNFSDEQVSSNLVFGLIAFSIFFGFFGNILLSPIVVKWTFIVVLWFVFLANHPRPRKHIDAYTQQLKRSLLDKDSTLGKHVLRFWVFLSEEYSPQPVNCFSSVVEIFDNRYWLEDGSQSSYYAAHPTVNQPQIEEISQRRGLSEKTDFLFNGIQNVLPPEGYTFKTNTAWHVDLQTSDWASRCILLRTQNFRLNETASGWIEVDQADQRIWRGRRLLRLIVPTHN